MFDEPLTDHPTPQFGPQMAAIPLTTSVALLDAVLYAIEHELDRTSASPQRSR